MNEPLPILLLSLALVLSVIRPGLADEVYSNDFSSSLFEGKGTADESWGLDNVKVTTASPIG